jgi:hypothetical protein
MAKHWLTLFSKRAGLYVAFWRDRNRPKEAHTVLLQRARERWWLDRMYSVLEPEAL